MRLSNPGAGQVVGGVLSAPHRGRRVRQRVRQRVYARIDNGSLATLMKPQAVALLALAAPASAGTGCAGAKRAADALSVQLVRTPGKDLRTYKALIAYLGASYWASTIIARSSTAYRQSNWLNWLSMPTT
jgi:hypothetical protein